MTQTQFNKDKERLLVKLPEGNEVTYLLDSQNPDRFQQGNIISTVRTPGPRGGDQTEISMDFTLITRILNYWKNWLRRVEKSFHENVAEIVRLVSVKLKRPSSKLVSWRCYLFQANQGGSVLSCDRCCFRFVSGDLKLEKRLLTHASNNGLNGRG